MSFEHTRFFRGMDVTAGRFAVLDGYIYIFDTKEGVFSEMSYVDNLHAGV